MRRLGKIREFLFQQRKFKKVENLEKLGLWITGIPCSDQNTQLNCHFLRKTFILLNNATRSPGTNAINDSLLSL